jgi:hypothetical protein
VLLSLSSGLRFHELTPRIPSSLGVQEIRESSLDGVESAGKDDGVLVHRDEVVRDLLHEGEARLALPKRLLVDRHR